MCSTALSFLQVREESCVHNLALVVGAILGEIRFLKNLKRQIILHVLI